MIDLDQMFSNNAYVHNHTHMHLQSDIPAWCTIYMSRPMVKHLLALQLPRVLVLVLYLVTCLENLDSWWHLYGTYRP